MKTQTKLVTTSITTILIVTIIASIFGWNFTTFDSRFSEQQCSREGKYCIFDDIPIGMMFTRPEQSLQEIPEFQGDLSEYLTLTYPTKDNYAERPIAPETESIPTPERFYIWDLENYRCTSTGENPKIIEYFAEFCGSNIKYGCENERRAMVCENIYLIQENQDYESKLYGPYDIPNTIN